jgi:hypothetical protein
MKPVPHVPQESQASECWVTKTLGDGVATGASPRVAVGCRRFRAALQNAQHVPSKVETVLGQHLDKIWTTFGQHYSIWTLDSAGTNLQSWFSLGLRRYFRRQQGGRRHLNSDIMGPPTRLNKTIKRITICLSQTPYIQFL